MLRKYTYSGPPSGVTLQGGREILFWPGRKVELDDEHPYVRRLVARRHLIAVEAGPPVPLATESPEPRKRNTRPNENSAAPAPAPKTEND